MRRYILLILSFFVLNSTIFSIEVPLNTIIEKLEPVKDKNFNEKLEHLLDGADEKTYLLSNSHPFHLTIIEDGEWGYKLKFYEGEEEVSELELQIGRDKKGHVADVASKEEASVSGNDLLHLADRLAILFDLNELTLMDVSSIYFEGGESVSLRHLHILLSKSHKGWYESKGYEPYDYSQNSTKINNYKRAKEIFASALSSVKCDK